MIFSERLKLKDDVVPIILDPMSHHTSVSKDLFTLNAKISAMMLLNRNNRSLMIIYTRRDLSQCEKFWLEQVAFSPL